MQASSDAAIQTCRIMGVEIAEGRSDLLIPWMDERFANGERLYLAFANANLLNYARKRFELSRALNKFLVLNDGLGADLANLIINGRKFPENLNGTDFIPRLLRHSDHTFRVFVLGGQPGVAETSLKNLKRQYPRHEFVGSHHGYFPGESNEDVVARIRQSGADVLLVGLGNPMQELWLANNLEKTGCKLGVGVGAFLDFSSGRVTRAPAFVRALRSEWLFRLSLEPKRMLKRYTWGMADFLLAATFERFNSKLTQ